MRATRTVGVVALLLAVTCGGAAHAKSIVEGSPEQSNLGTVQEQYAKAAITIQSSPEKTVTVVVADSGKVQALTSPAGLTLGEILEDHGVNAEEYRTPKSEEVNVEQIMKAGLTRFLFRVETTASFEEIKLDAPVEKIESAFMPKGTKVLLEEGEPGSALKTTIASTDLSEEKKFNSRSKKTVRPIEIASITVLEAPQPRLVLVGANEAESTLTPPGLLYPLSTTHVTSPYGMRTHPVTGIYKLHDGADFSAPCGTEVRAITGGVVDFVGSKVGYGTQVGLDHGASFGSSYSHLSATLVEVGDSVAPGDLVGLVGVTGYTTGCHLHLMTTFNDDPLDPLELFTDED